ncbi:phosphopantetheine-binding protein [Prevotella sp. E13-27]|jgi:acyl carrier protein|uniref:phosphopantetheine-binding protein n=1 Tax=Prevotella sp. E13-27 TaxID=2938122 RepID=UPI00200A480A|nr:phosphopantetheine-binding protein [Prevotella sp. E13-27]MCK8623655.1 phosphopantetheine-binding protein [Prevotella sp. E13-27]
MKINEFIAKFAEAIEVDNVEALTAETEFRELDEWSSLSVMLLIAFYDEEFGKELTQAQIKSANTLQDLYNIAIA